MFWSLPVLCRSLFPHQLVYPLTLTWASIPNPDHNLTYTWTPTAEGNIVGNTVWGGGGRLWHKTCSSPSLGVYLRAHVPWMWGRWQPGCRWAGRWHPETAHSAVGSRERWAQGPLEGTGPVRQTWCCRLAVWSVRKINNMSVNTKRKVGG